MRLNLEVIGTISISESGTHDLTTDEYRKLVRPRACELGGTHISTEAVVFDTGSPFSSGYTRGSYVVLRPRPDETSEPQTF